MSSATKSAGPSALARKRAMLADRLRKAASGPRQELLSLAQQRLWFLDQLEPNSPLYNIGAVARVDGTIDLALLEKSLNQIICRHETLRTRFGCPEETPVQLIDPRPDFSLKVINLSGQPGNDRESEAQRLIRAELNRPFNLSSEHPLRATWIELQPEEHRLVLILHHIIAD